MNQTLHTIRAYIKKRPFFLWAAVSVALSTYVFWGLRLYWFRYESLGLQYIFQHPGLVKSVYERPENIPYLAHVFLYWWQFALFQYHALFFFVMSVAMAIGALWLAFVFFKRLGINIVARVIALLFFASALFGIETITWDPINGFQNYYVVALLFGALLFIDAFRRNAHKNALIIGLSLYLLAIVFSQFRSFLLFFPVIFYVLFFFEKTSQIRNALLTAIIVITAAGFAPALFWAKGFSEQGLHTIPVGAIIWAGFGNVGAAVAALDQFVLPPWIYVVIGAFITIGGVAISIRQKGSMRGKITGFLTLSTICNAVIMGVMVRFAGSEPMIYQNTHRFLTFITLFAFPLVGIGIASIFSLRLPKLGRGLIIILLVALILAQTSLAKSAVVKRSHETHTIRQFYTEFKQEIPTLSDGAVVQTVASFPHLSVDPFTGNQFGTPEYYLAGLYHIDAAQVFRTTRFEDSLKVLQDQKWGTEHLYVVSYSESGVHDLTSSARILLETPATFTVMTKEAVTKFNPEVSRVEPIILENLELPAYAPFELRFEARFTPVNVKEKSLELPIWWQPAGLEQFRDEWSQKVSVPVDSQWHSYSVTISANEGETLQKIKFGGFTNQVKFDLREVRAEFEPMK